MRHTVGLVDPVTSLGHEVSTTGCRYFCLSSAAIREGPRATPATIAEALGATGVDYRVTVEANEQYADVKALAALVTLGSRGRMTSRRSLRVYFTSNSRCRARKRGTPRLRPWANAMPSLSTRRILITTHLAGAASWISRRVVEILQRSYKALLNGVRSAQWNREGIPTFVAAEDLTAGRSQCSRIPPWQRFSASPMPNAMVTIMSTALPIHRRTRRAASLLPIRLVRGRGRNGAAENTRWRSGDRLARAAGLRFGR